MNTDKWTMKTEHLALIHQLMGSPEIPSRPGGMCITFTRSPRGTAVANPGVCVTSKDYARVYD
eukprot:2246058-Lingulodinium_polyedra.AAC.1